MIDLLKIARQAQGCFYIRRLSTLVSPASKITTSGPILFEVHPVSRTVVDSQFGNSLAYRSDISRVSGSETLDSDLDFRPPANIAQAVEPVGKECSLADPKHKEL
jgi:hypothetical protein